jgi:hypothetical protein
MKFVDFFLCVWVIFAPLLDPDTDPGIPLKTDPIRIHNTGTFSDPKIVWRALQIIFSPFFPQNTETPQLWAELEAASGPEYPVEAVMKTWTEQKGFPVITVQSKQVIILFFSFALLQIFLYRSFTLFIILFIQFICAFANFF